MLAARILGQEESPPAERKREQDGVDPSGMNFVGGGAGVVEGMHEAPKLGTQVDKFRGWSGTTSSTKTSRIPSRSSPSPASATTHASTT